LAEQPKVVAGGGEHGVDAVAVASLEMADYRLDGGATPNAH